MRTTILIVIFLLLVSGFVYSTSLCSPHSDTIQDIPINCEIIYKIGSSKDHEDFYHPSWFCVDSNENVYILDTKNSRVQCFSKDGHFFLSFGKFGQGPGELTNSPLRIKILEDENIYIIDTHKKVNVYNKNGQFIKMIRIEGPYRDIELVDGNYYFCDCILTRGSKPIHVMDQSGRGLRSFGIVIEPQEGLIDEIAKQPKSEMLVDLSGSSRIIRTTKKELINSQAVPYRLIKYDTTGKIIDDFVGDYEFESKPYSIVQKNGYPFLMPTLPRPSLYTPIIRNDGRIIVPFSKKERDHLYCDVYNHDFTNQIRYKVMEMIERPLIHVYIDDMNNLYCLVRPEDSDPYLVKYRLSIKL